MIDRNSLSEGLKPADPSKFIPNTWFLVFTQKCVFVGESRYNPGQDKLKFGIPDSVAKLVPPAEIEAMYYLPPKDLAVVAQRMILQFQKIPQARCSNGDSFFVPPAWGLGDKEKRGLLCLMKNSGTVVSKEQLWQVMYPEADYDPNSTRISERMGSAKRKLPTEVGEIQTVKENGGGYIFVATPK